MCIHTAGLSQQGQCRRVSASRTATKYGSAVYSTLSWQHHVQTMCMQTACFPNEANVGQSAFHGPQQNTAVLFTVLWVDNIAFSWCVCRHLVSPTRPMWDSQRFTDHDKIQQCCLQYSKLTTLCSADVYADSLLYPNEANVGQSAIPNFSRLQWLGNPVSELMFMYF